MRQAAANVKTGEILLSQRKLVLLFKKKNDIGVA